jgi:integrase
VPGLGSFAVADITATRIRRWRKNLLDSGLGPVTVAKAYRLLKTIMTTAVDDRLIRRNPCRTKGAGAEKSPERPVLALSQVFVLTDAFADRRRRLLILLAVFCSLRWGKLAALRREHIDMSAGLVRVEVAVVELTNGALVTGPPKSASGVRWVSIPPFLLPDVTDHLDQFTGTTDKPARLHRSQGYPATAQQLHPSVAQGAGGGRNDRHSLSRPAAYRVTRWPVVRPGLACANSWTGWAIAPRAPR